MQCNGDFVLVGGRLAVADRPGDSLLVQDGRIAWIGPREALPKEARALAHIALEGRLVTPGLIDCHTHLIFMGSRAHEFALRLAGASYAEIAAAGGGIVSTVAATREASEEALFATALPRAKALLAEGVTTLEVKSGYGLDHATELKMLRVARRLGPALSVHVVKTFLGAHAVPPEYRGRSGAYLEEVCLPVLRQGAAEGLVDAVDAFCEGIAFSPDDIARLFAEARALGLPVRLHAEQLSHSGGAALAARFGALSADHLEYATEADAQAMAEAGTVAVLLPGAFYFLRETRLPPIAAFRAKGVPMAVATDLNPGSSPLFSLLTAMNMATVLFGLTPEEALLGTTAHAARALGLNDRGRLAPGLRADLCIWDAETVADMSYRIGFAPLQTRIVGGHSC